MDTVGYWVPPGATGRPYRFRPRFGAITRHRYQVRLAAPWSTPRPSVGSGKPRRGSSSEAGSRLKLPRGPGGSWHVRCASSWRIEDSCLVLGRTSQVVGTVADGAQWPL